MYRPILLCCMYIYVETPAPLGDLTYINSPKLFMFTILCALMIVCGAQSWTAVMGDMLSSMARRYGDFHTLERRERINFEIDYIR